MKIFVATILLLVSFYIIKVDLIEGTIPLAYSFQPVECDENIRLYYSRDYGWRYTPVFILSVSFSSNLSLTLRDLADFYELKSPFYKSIV